MITEHLAAPAILAAALLLVVGCSSTDDTSPPDPTTTRPATTAPQSTAGAEAGAADATTPAATAATAPDVATTPPTALPTTPPTALPTTAPVADGPCMDPSSPAATSALASLGATAPGGNGWIAGAYDESVAPCPQLVWLMAETPGGTASSPSHVLFFHDGTYLGTATSDAYAYTQVVGANGNTVSVQYRWLEADDANCCPSGGPAVIDYVWDSGVVMTQPLPQEMLDSYGR